MCKIKNHLRKCPPFPDVREIHSRPPPPSVVSVPKGSVQGFIVFDPVADADFPEIRISVTDKHVSDSGVDNQPFAHGTAAGIFYILPGIRFPPGQIHGGADHFLTLCADNGIGLGVDRPAQFIPLAPWNIHLLPQAVTKVCTVFPASRRTSVTGGNHFVIFYKYSAIVAAQTGTPFGYYVCQIQIIIDFVSSCHGIWFLLVYFFQILSNIFVLCKQLQKPDIY